MRSLFSATAATTRGRRSAITSTRNRRRRKAAVHNISAPVIVERYSCYLLFGYCLLLLLATSTTTVAADDDERNHDYDEEMIKHLELFQQSEDTYVLGPTSFRRPTDFFLTQQQHDDTDDDDVEIVPYLQPIYGKHRPDQDAVVAFAAEYPLSNYITFIESLRKTAGFTGDIVLAISPLDQRKSDVWEYLTEPNNHIVLYAPVLVCYNAEQEMVESAKGGMRVCTSDNLYARKNKQDGTTLHPLPDPRHPRTVQTLRYEIYWLMVSQYIDKHSWILLVDARDTVFQTNPFEHVPRETDVTEQSGLLYFFGENVEATRLGQSKSNRKWLAAAYGESVTNLLSQKPTICSGATMGEQIALEMYIRAMILESDETNVVLAGADQGFHNFLFYSSKLANAHAIHGIVVFDQGQGIVNNMGALRTKKLDEWGNGKIVETRTNNKKTEYTVLNWDGTISPVVHQYDRHKELSDYFYKVVGGKYMKDWKDRKKNITKKRRLRLR